MLRIAGIILIFIILNAVLLNSAKINTAMRSAPAVPVYAAAVPDFKWHDFKGKTHDIKDLAGHTVVLHFWASWCGPCRREFPELMQAAKILGDDVIFLTLSGDDDIGTAQSFIKRMEEANDAKMPDNVLIGYDGDKKIAADTFQAAYYPESIVLDPSLHMRTKFGGAVHWNSEKVLGILKSFK